MKLAHCLLITFLLAQTSQAVEINSSLLKSLVETKNIRVEAAKLETEAALERKGSLLRSFLPSIELYGAQESFKIGKQDQKSQPLYGVEAKINIFNAGRDLLQSDIRDLQVQKKTFESARIESEVLEEVRNTYWEIIYFINKIELLNSTVKVNADNLKSAQRRISSGVATESDRVEFEMKSVDLSQELLESKLHLEIKIRHIAVLLGFDNSKELTFSEKLEHQHDYEMALAHNKKDHEFLYKETEIQSAVNQLSATQLNRIWAPKLDAYASYNQFNEREKEFASAEDRTESRVGVRLSLSLGEAFESYKEAASLKKEALSAQKMSELKKKEIDIHVSNEMAELELLHGLVHAAEENIVRAEKYYKLTQSEYVRGVKNSPDVLGASEKLFEVKKKRIEIVRDFQMAKAHILSKIGK
jgi:outer membrane protein